MGYILGLGGPYYHDASACLVDEAGSIVAFVEEERLTRRKRNWGRRSCALSASYCLARAGIRLAEVDEIAVAWNPRWPQLEDEITDPDLIRELLDPGCFGGFIPRSLSVIDHHLAHAASSFYVSGFREAAVLAVDGAGDGAATSLFRGGPDGLRLLRRYPFTQSLGWFYEAVGEHVGLADGTGAAGRLMGLAAYGSPRYDFSFLRDEHEGGYLIDLARYGIPPGEEARSEFADWTFYQRQRRAFGAALEDLGVRARSRMRHYDRATGAIVEEGFAPDHADLAASAQQVLERCLLRLARTAMEEAGVNDLCIAGGVAFNCSANGRLHRESGLGRFFVQPAAGDAGCAIGAALECARRAGSLSISGKPQRSAALGPDFNDAEVAAALDRVGVRGVSCGDEIATTTARLLADGAAIGWVQGPCEGGPRALGQRSILADPRHTSQRDRINRDIKRREKWRPLAPSLAAASAKRNLDNPGPSEFMIVACQASEEMRAAAPGVVHVDGSVRPHLVEESINPPYARLLRAFAAETGVPILLNTSFNREDEPIVCTPTDALRTFFSTPIDALVLGGILIVKSDFRAGRRVDRVGARSVHGTAEGCEGAGSGAKDR